MKVYSGLRTFTSHILMFLSSQRVTSVFTSGEQSNSLALFGRSTLLRRFPVLVFFKFTALSFGDTDARSLLSTTTKR